MKKRAAKKKTARKSAKRKAAPKKKKAAKKKRPRRDPRALTERQLRLELGATDSTLWGWMLANGIPINADQTFDLIKVAAWIAKGAAKRHGSRG